MILFSVFHEAVTSNTILNVNSPEDSFIELMALGHIVTWNEKQHIEAASLEGLLTHVIEVSKLLPHPRNRVLRLFSLQTRTGL